MSNTQSLQSIFQGAADEASAVDSTPEMTRQGRMTGSTQMPSTAVIKGREDQHAPWKEIAKVISVSGAGAGFFLERECPVGCLLSLMFQLPANMRSYDKDKKLYRVWGLVQHCYAVSGFEGTGFHVGVAFIGKNPPASYHEDPLQSYKIVGMGKDGLWRVGESRTPFKTRKTPRFWNALSVTLFSLDPEGNSTAHDRCFTENISEMGASVTTYLAAGVGDPVKFLCDSPPFSSLAVVRNTSTGIDEKPRLHLEFVEDTFPILEITAPIEEQGEH